MDDRKALFKKIIQGKEKVSSFRDLVSFRKLQSEPKNKKAKDVDMKLWLQQSSVSRDSEFNHFESRTRFRERFYKEYKVLLH